MANATTTMQPRMSNPAITVPGAMQAGETAMRRQTPCLLVAVAVLALAAHYPPIRLAADEPKGEVAAANLRATINRAKDAKLAKPSGFVPISAL